MEKKIELSKEELEVIEKQIKGGVGYEPETDEEKELMMGVIDKADALMRELDAFDELGESLVGWYYNKYKEQNITQ